MKHGFFLKLALLSIAMFSCGGIGFGAAGDSAVSFDLNYGRLEFLPNSAAKVVFSDGVTWGGGEMASFILRTKEGKQIASRSVSSQNGKFLVEFDDGARAIFKVTPQKGFALFELESFEAKGEYELFNIMNISVPTDSTIAGLVNKAESGGKTVTVMTASPNARPLTATRRGSKGDRAGCSHDFIQTNNAKSGKYAAKFTASCDEKGGGWSIRGRSLTTPVNLSNIKKLRAWVHGDGNGQALKIQLNDGKNGNRDDYIAINFKGWKQVDLVRPALNTLDYSSVKILNIYYNGLPANKKVECLVDRIEAVLDDGKGGEKVVLLEDFESPYSDFWNDPSNIIAIQSIARHGLIPVKFGVLCCPANDWTNVVPEFQVAAGIPSPRLGGVWNKTTPQVRESYFFLTSFKESQFDEALAIAKRGNFKMILLLCTWAKTHGHYEINRANYPDGIESLKRTFDRFNAEGIKVGLHFLAASIDAPDAYITPVPDKRLVRGARVALARDIDEKTKFIETVDPPTGFPATETKPYTESGRTLWIDDELIYYDTVSLEKPYGFTGCKRGHFKTKASNHAKGTPVDHLVRAYGYYMYDLDSTLADEIADNFAKVGNAVNLQMVYFDGSERLQRPEDGRDHWYYNAKLHKIFYDRLNNRDKILFQGSSTSPYSWHQLARTASADGHDDLKAYLEERSGGFASYYRNNCYPLDIGWYYAYDKKATLDMYEYVLCATIAYNSSMSLQVSVDAAKAHPFTGEILDMIRKYDDLRLSGRVPQKLREYMQMDPVLAGLKTEEQRNALLDKRKDFRFVTKDGKEGFQRVVYSLWHDVNPEDATSFEWEFDVKNGKALIGMQIQVKADPKATPDKTVVQPRVEFDGKTITLPLTLTQGQYGTVWPNEAVVQYGQPLPAGKYYNENKGAALELPNGKYKIRFATAEPLKMPVRVRVTQTPDEFHVIP